MLEEAEVKAGFVLHLDPDRLEREGGTFTCDAAARVQEGHFFVCLAERGGKGIWLPLYSNPGVGRQNLVTSGRSGHVKWTKGRFFWHKDQVWAAPNAAVVKAADAGGDMSQPGSRNLLAEAELPSLK